jgi:transposase
LLFSKVVGTDDTTVKCWIGIAASQKRADLPVSLVVIREQVLPKIESGQAIAYALKNRAALTRYRGDGDLTPMAPERSLRGFAIGRNNRIFFVSDNGGKTAAVLRSFVTSHELVNVDSFAWFRDVLGDIAEHPIKRAR